MTHKRFECANRSRIIIDNETKLHYIMTLDWECQLVTRLLNQLYEKNEELKIDLGIAKDNKALDKEIIDDLQEALKKVEKENEELKSDYDDVVSALFKANEENEKLKKRIKRNGRTFYDSENFDEKLMELEKELEERQ